MEYLYLSFEEQNELVKKSLAGDEKATVTLINFMSPFAAKYASNFISSGVLLEDLMQEAVCGILQAIPRYRNDKGTKFSTYCLLWIQKNITAYLNRSMIRLPSNVLSEFKKYNRFVQTNLKQFGEYPTDEIILTELSISKEDLELFKMLSGSSLVKLDEIGLQNYDDDSNPEDSIVHKILIEDALDHVNEREKYVIINHRGLFSHPPLTFNEIAKEIGCSSEWARQLERSGIKKIRKYFSKIDVNF